VTKKLMYDEYGEAYEVDTSVLSMPAGPGPHRTLTDSETGKTYQIPASMFSGVDGATGATGPGRGLLQPTPTYHERLIEILLERCTITNPGIRQDIELLIGPVLAIGKITSKEEYNIILLEIENLVRALYMSGAISDEDSVYLVDQLTFFARWQARRSITFDGKPNERELWTIQSIHQKSETVSPDTGGSGLMSGLARMFGRR